MLQLQSWYIYVPLSLKGLKTVWNVYTSQLIADRVTVLGAFRASSVWYQPVFFSDYVKSLNKLQLLRNLNSIQIEAKLWAYANKQHDRWIDTMTLFVVLKCKPFCRNRVRDKTGRKRFLETIKKILNAREKI